MVIDKLLSNVNVWGIFVVLYTFKDGKMYLRSYVLYFGDYKYIRRSIAVSKYR